MKEKHHFLLFTILISIGIFALTHRTTQPGIGAVGAQGFLMYGMWYWSKETARPLSKEAWTCACFALLYCITELFNTSSLVSNLGSLGFWIANFLFFGFAFGLRFKEHHPLSLIVNHIRTLYKGMHRESLYEFKSQIKTTHFRPYFKGLIISYPILMVFFGLFCLADDAFASQSNELISGFLNGGLWNIVYGAGILLGINAFVVMLFDGLYFRSIELPDGKEHNPSLHQESGVVLAMVNLLFGWFLCSQIPYLFGGEAYRAALNLNYADYAVAGFYELMTVVALVFAMVVSLRYFHREQIGNLQKGLYGLLMLQSGIILSSAFIRMNLYIEVYGYTQARIFGMVYILTAGIALVLTLQNVWSESSQAILIKRVLVLSGLSIFAFSLLSPDLNSVYWNVEDERELARKDLSPGELYAAQKAVPYFALYDEERKVLTEYCTSDWRSFNFRRQKVCSMQ